MSGSIGGIDASIPLRAGQGVQQNGLAAQNPGQFVNTLGAINQLKLFPLQQQQMALGIDQQKLAIAGQQLQQGLTKLNAGIGYMLPLLLNKDGTPTTGVSAKDITTALADASHPDSGVLSPSQAAGLLQTLPNGGSDPAANRAWLLRNYAQIRAAAGAHEQALQMIGMSPATRDTGQAIQSGGVAGPLTGQPGAFTPQGQATQVYPSRAQGASQVSWQKSDGTTAQGTLSQFWDATGRGETMGPAFNQDGSQAAPAGSTGPAQAGPQQAGAPSPLGTGRLPKQAGGPIEGPAPGTIEPQQQSGLQYAADQRAAGSFGQRVFPLKQAIGLLSETQTGPGSETLNQFRSFLVSMSNQGLLPRSITPDAINQANFDELRKYMSNYITNLPFAAGSDARMAEAISGNPHANLSTIANQDLARVMVGLERFRQAQYLSFNQRHPNAPAQAAGQYGAYAADFGTKYDPRAFAYDLMDETARTKMYNAMSDAEKARYRASVKLAYSIPGLMQ